MDPWEKLAIEAQFKALLEEPTDGFPATLQYLMENLETLVPPRRAALQERIEYLMDCFLRGDYAIEMVKSVWGDHAKLAEYATETLDKPMDLIFQVWEDSPIAA